MRCRKKQITFSKILGKSCPAQRDVSLEFILSGAEVSRKMKATELVFQAKFYLKVYHFPFEAS
jgi:CRISPR/Cas system-associated exonuclease Cas4 (RecB family)